MLATATHVLLCLGIVNVQDRTISPQSEAWYLVSLTEKCLDKRNAAVAASSLTLFSERLVSNLGSLFVLCSF